MKKLFMFLAVAGLATFGASCSKSDDNGGGTTPPAGDKVLELSANKTEIKEGETVAFTSKSEGKVVTGTDTYVNDVKGTNPYKFDKEGEYKVVSKKTGYKDSNVVTIKVAKGDVKPEEKTLVLAADVTKVTEGGKVTFTVKEGTNNVDGAVIKMNGTTVVTSPWTAGTAGTYKFVASKDGFKNSNEITVVVEKATVTFENFVSLDGVQRELSYGIFGVDAYKDKDANGKDVWVPILYPLNDKSGDVAVFTIQVFKGNNAGADYEAAFGKGGTVYGLTVLIKNVKGQPLKTPANTPVADWMYGGGLFTLVNGDTQYMTPDNNTQFGWAAQADPKGMQFAMTIEGGAFTEVLTAAGKTAKNTTLDVDFQVLTEGMFYFEKQKPASRQSFSVKGLSSNSLKAKKMNR
ncbi:MAG: hypothetical protein LBI72_14155 [Flavobacteriaceae bacterium]|jgi:hypothetical protein|nr:hypothetical protein [Flavobacteriaceae bacterium]